jgi:hypothetical protein
VRTLAFAVIAALGLANVAVAAPTVGVVVTGEPSLQSKLHAQVSGWIKQHGFAEAETPLSADALKTLTSCFVIEDMQCARGVVDHQSTSDFLLFVRADLVGGKHSKEANLVAYWFLKDRDAVADKRNCKPCTGTVLATISTELLTAIYDETGLAKARLKIAEPPGLVVMLDGANVGVTPLEQDVAPGAHTVALVRDDTTLGTATVEAKAGDVTEVKVPIEARMPATGGRHDTTDHPSRLVPGLVITAGTGLLITGGVFLYYGHKGGPDDPLIYPSATKQGAIVAGVGGAILITGLVLLLHGSDSDPPSNGPTAALTPGGTIVGWAGQF